MLNNDNTFFSVHWGGGVVFILLLLKKGKILIMFD